MTKGAEQFCQGILDADDRINEKYTEAQTFFSDVKGLEAIYNSEIHSDVAILYDYDNRWSWHNQPQSHAFNYTDEILRFYTPYHDLNIMTDVIDLKKTFEPYKVLMVPIMQIMDSETIDRLRAFASSGGTVVLGFRSGIKDRDNNLYFGESPIKSLIGAEIKSYESLGHGVVKPLISYWNTNHNPKTCSVWRDLIEPIDAEPLLKYDDEFYGHYAAVVKNKVGSGSVYYVGCGLSENGMREIVKEIISDQNISPNLTPDGVESVVRNYDGNTVEILLNHNGTAIEHDGLNLKPFDFAIKKR
jgi:beta-galactosidase